MKKAIRLAGICLAAILVGLAVRLCVVSLVRIPGNGAQPMLMAGDRVTVGRMAYGIRMSPMRWWGYVRYGAKRVERGDFIAFNDPTEGSGVQTVLPDERAVFVGQCLAVPGDSLWVDSLGNVRTVRPKSKRKWKVVELPRCNAFVTITPDNIAWYARTINLHEGAQAIIKDGSLHINGRLVTSFRFMHDYYWVSAGNKDSASPDSRTFGFVPDRFVIGRLRRVLFSINPDAPWYAPFRAARFMKKVGNE